MIAIEDAEWVWEWIVKEELRQKKNVEWKKRFNRKQQITQGKIIVHAKERLGNRDPGHFAQVGQK